MVIVYEGQLIKKFDFEKAVQELERKVSRSRGDAMRAYEKAYFIADRILRSP
jgi:hypothetical protein